MNHSMYQDIVVTIDELGVPTLRKYHHPACLPYCSPLPPDVIRTYPSLCTCVFIDPDHLMSVFLNPEIYEQIAKHMQSLRLVLLNPVANATLTELEVNGDINGPNMAPLLEKWWVALQVIPQGHQIRFMTYDMFFPQDIEKKEIVGILRGLSSTIAKKGPELFASRVDGCEKAIKEWQGNLMVYQPPPPPEVLERIMGDPL